MIQPERVRRLNERAENPRGRHVLYWMQQAQRATGNPALEYAAREANRLDLPLRVSFGLTDDYPEANGRHYAFLLEGLLDVRRTLAKRGIAFILRRGAPDAVAVELARGAALAVTDRGYLRIQREWRARAAQALDVPLIEIEGDVVVPVDAVSDHDEFAARTLRPKIHRLLDRFLVPLAETPVRRRAEGPGVKGLALDAVEPVLAAMKIDRSVPRTDAFRGGATEATRRLHGFVAHRLGEYAELRSDPSIERASGLSAYLHFGHISPLDIALAVRDSAAPRIAVDAFLEELIVRRELSMNFVTFNPRYDRYDGLPDWARKTLGERATDGRAYVYPFAVWEHAETHDPYWNAAQREMVRTGRMHNYMRMYWGKKILEWSATPEEAFDTALRLNNRYALDGRDANSFAGVAWCFGKHDRPWTRRPVFGTIRYMNAAGLDRKFDMASYVARNG